ncbi:MAG: ADP-ribosylglycohydrolase family protein [Bacteroidetes bacterium]|nr:ADP-ribosylglycohydrolase family protein [Bacteroidota bacterium]
MTMKNTSRDILLGLTVGDALGVPYEFLRRERMDVYPATDMTGYGAHHQPAGTWSDDSSLALCLAEMLTGDYDLRNLANRFINWYDYAYWSAHGHVFDVGIATSGAIHSLKSVTDPTLAGGRDEYSNGNGSLMRILPLLPYIKDKGTQERFEIVRAVSSLTHAHIRSVLACFIYMEYAIEIAKGTDKLEALSKIRKVIPDICVKNNVNNTELYKYHKVLALKVEDYDVAPIENEGRANISGSGYVLSTLEAAIWCLITTADYESCVLTAVNLGEDTDTTACVAGGLAGLLYGYQSIPKKWLEVLARRADIEALADKLQNKYYGR